MNKKIIFSFILFGWMQHNCCSLPVAVLETERLFLRPVDIHEDLEAIAKLALNPLVIKLTGFFPVMQDLQEVENYMINYLIGDQERGILPGYHAIWAVVHKTTRQVIGLIGFFAYNPMHQRAEFGYVINPDYWNCGYAVEGSRAIIDYAFAQGLIRIYATIDPENIASERVAQKLQMSFEGLLRSYLIVRGECKDRKLYAIIKQ